LIKSSDSCFDLSGVAGWVFMGGVAIGLGGGVFTLFEMLAAAGFAGTGWGSDGLEGAGTTPGTVEGCDFFTASKISMIVL
jgi:hypothetical protein